MMRSLTGVLGGREVEIMSREQQCLEFIDIFYPDSEMVNVRPKNVHPLDKSLTQYSEETQGRVVFNTRFSTSITKDKCVDLVVNKNCKNLLVQMGDNLFSFCRFESDVIPKEEQIEQIVSAFKNWDYFKDNLICVLDSGGRSVHSVLKVDPPNQNNKTFVNYSGVKNYFQKNDGALGCFHEQFIRIAGSKRRETEVKLLYLK